ncbi:MAG TPA: B12-binding domain-containing radical SAM protein, partial [Planctomycetaceae bacterium]|nr:B12-binding domain-containing radical SAM protein [Planctomycetaceae bacterium]
RRFLLRQKRLRTVQIKCHDVESSLLEGMLGRADRRAADAIERVWREGARFDAWNDHLDVDRWWRALAEAGVDEDQVLHRPRTPDEENPWDHVGIRQGREYLIGEWEAGRGI